MFITAFLFLIEVSLLTYNRTGYQLSAPRDACLRNDVHRAACVLWRMLMKRRLSRSAVRHGLKLTHSKPLWEKKSFVSNLSCFWWPNYFLRWVRTLHRTVYNTVKTCLRDKEMGLVQLYSVHICICTVLVHSGLIQTGLVHSGLVHSGCVHSGL